MYILNQNDFEYRFGDSGPKYLMKGPRANFGVVQLKPNQDFNNHYHNIMEENFFILEGTFEFTIDGKTIKANPGDFVHVEPGERHYLKNISDTNAKAIFCLAPFEDNDKVEVPLQQ